MKEDRLIINGLDVTSFKEADEEFSFEFSIEKRLVEYPLIIKVYEGSEADLRMREYLKQANQYKIHIDIERI